MARRWIGSIDVEYDAGKGLILTGQASPTSLVGGTKTVSSAATPQPLVATPTPCCFVWIGARVDNSGNPQNIQPVFIGDAANQNIALMPANYEGFVIRIDDASKLYLRVVTANEGVFYRIFA